MAEEPILKMSPLCRTITEGGHDVQIHIYASDSSDWILEVEDDAGNSTVWEDEFASDQAALDEVLQTIREEGIECLVGPPSERDV